MTSRVERMNLHRRMGGWLHKSTIQMHGDISEESENKFSSFLSG